MGSTPTTAFIAVHAHVDSAVAAALQPTGCTAAAACAASASVLLDFGRRSREGVLFSHRSPAAVPVFDADDWQNLHFSAASLLDPALLLSRTLQLWEKLPRKVCAAVPIRTTASR